MDLPLYHSLKHPCLFYISKHDPVSIYPIPHRLISLLFLFSSFPLFTIIIPLPDPVILFLPFLSLLSPFFHLWPASTNEHCHGSIDTGWSVCSRHREQNECGCHASFPPDSVIVLVCVISICCWLSCLWLVLPSLEQALSNNGNRAVIISWALKKPTKAGR